MNIKIYNYKDYARLAIALAKRFIELHPADSEDIIKKMNILKASISSDGKESENEKNYL